MKQTLIAATLATLLLGTTGASRADEDEERQRFTISSQEYRDECGSCHIAYPPQLLNKASWQQVMGGLDKHFGTNASLSPEVQARLASYLQDSAADTSGKPSPRITQTAWFQREHDEIGAATWQRKAIGSPANCGACHQGAEQGDFSESAIRIPR